MSGGVGIPVPDRLNLPADLDPDQTLGVAVSGGGDSVALLHLLAARLPHLHAVTVDHGLRPESAGEAEAVARQCAELGVAHSTLRWEGWNGTGNLQQAARHARYRLISDWAAAQGITDIALGHTQDDQAETLLLRLARGSGVDGLSAMAPVRHSGGLRWLRPLLDIGREELRTYLRERGIGWIDDPSNDNPAFDRIKARQALALLAPLGIEADGLAETVKRMRDIRRYLECETRRFAEDCAGITSAGEIIVDAGAFFGGAEEMRRRLFIAVVKWMNGAGHPPRARAVAEALDRLTREDATATLQGVLARRHGDTLHLRREPARVAAPVPVAAGVWDHRWIVTPTPDAEAADTIAALGDDGLAQVPDWRDCGAPREVLLTTPALWRETRLIAAPLAGIGGGWRISMKSGSKALFRTLFTS